MCHKPKNVNTTAYDVTESADGVTDEIENEGVVVGESEFSWWNVHLAHTYFHRKRQWNVLSKTFIGMVGPNGEREGDVWIFND